MVHLLLSILQITFRKCKLFLFCRSFANLFQFLKFWYGVDNSFEIENNKRNFVTQPLIDNDAFNICWIDKVKHRNLSGIQREWCSTSHRTSELDNYLLELCVLCLTLTRPIGLPPHAPVAQKVAEQCTLIASLVKRLFVRVDWTERLRDDSSTTDWVN